MALGPDLAFVPSGNESQMLSTWYLQSSGLMMNSSKPEDTVSLMRTILPLKDCGSLRMSQTVASTVLCVKGDCKRANEGDV